MNFASVLLYPIFLLLPAAGARDHEPSVDVVPNKAYAWPQYALPHLMTDAPLDATLLEDAFPEEAWQMRIEQRMTIRIAPRAALPMPPDMFMGMPGGPGVPQFTERKIGKCLSIAGIASVRPDRANRLMLFMRDHRLVSAELSRTCRARDFYSGFLLERNEDGRLCVERDTLLARNGMTCTLTRIRELVPQDH